MKVSTYDGTSQIAAWHWAEVHLSVSVTVKFETLYHTYVESTMKRYIFDATNHVFSVAFNIYSMYVNLK